MKRAHLRPQALLDRKEMARCYRQEAGAGIAEKTVVAARRALDQIELNPAVGSLRIGQELDVPSLRSWRVSGSFVYSQSANCRGSLKTGRVKETP